MTIPNHQTAPVVYSPVADERDLGKFLQHKGSEAWECVARAGAVLFRNFSVFSDKAFEDSLLNIKQLRPMDSYFMSEHGRSRVDGPATI
jgi:hypothetical protein